MLIFPLSTTCEKIVMTKTMKKRKHLPFLYPRMKKTAILTPTTRMTRVDTPKLLQGPLSTSRTTLYRIATRTVMTKMMRHLLHHLHQKAKDFDRKVSQKCTILPPARLIPQATTLQLERLILKSEE